MAARVMHRLATERRAIRHRALAARWQRPAIAFAIVESVIDVTVETIWAVIPGPRTDENAA
jgi:hypothetical protein